MADLISASSLLLAILTTLFGLFYNSINEILELKPNTHPVDDTPNYKKALGVRKTKVYPLLLSSIVLTLIFIPEAITNINESMISLYNLGLKGVTYDTIKTTYIAVTVFMIALNVNIVIVALNFNKQLTKLNPKRKLKNIPAKTG